MDNDTQNIDKKFDQIIEQLGDYKLTTYVFIGIVVIIVVVYATCRLKKASEKRQQARLFRRNTGVVTIGQPRQQQRMGGVRHHHGPNNNQQQQAPTPSIHVSVHSDIQVQQGGVGGVPVRSSSVASSQASGEYAMVGDASSRGGKKKTKSSAAANKTRGSRRTAVIDSGGTYISPARANLLRVACMNRLRNSQQQQEQEQQPQQRPSNSTPPMLTLWRGRLASLMSRRTSTGDRNNRTSPVSITESATVEYNTVEQHHNRSNTPDTSGDYMSFNIYESTR